MVVARFLCYFFGAVEAVSGRRSPIKGSECTGISDVLCHHIKPDQHKFLKKYSLRLNYEVFQSLSLIAGLYLVGGVVSFLVIIIKSQDSG